MCASWLKKWYLAGTEAVKDGQVQLTLKGCVKMLANTLMMPNSSRQYCWTSQSWNVVSPAMGIIDTKMAKHQTIDNKQKEMRRGQSYNEVKCSQHKTIRSGLLAKRAQVSYSIFSCICSGFARVNQYLPKHVQSDEA